MSLPQMTKRTRIGIIMDGPVRDIRPSLRSAYASEFPQRILGNDLAFPNAMQNLQNAPIYAPYQTNCFVNEEECQRFVNQYWYEIYGKALPISAITFIDLNALVIQLHHLGYEAILLTADPVKARGLTLFFLANYGFNGPVIEHSPSYDPEEIWGRVDYLITSDLKHRIEGKENNTILIDNDKREFGTNEFKTIGQFLDSLRGVVTTTTIQLEAQRFKITVNGQIFDGLQGAMPIMTGQVIAGLVGITNPLNVTRVGDDENDENLSIEEPNLIDNNAVLHVV